MSETPLNPGALTYKGEWRRGYLDAINEVLRKPNQDFMYGRGYEQGQRDWEEEKEQTT
jgi:hypothetical protein